MSHCKNFGMSIPFSALRTLFAFDDEKQLSVLLLNSLMLNLYTKSFLIDAHPHISRQLYASKTCANPSKTSSAVVLTVLAAFATIIDVIIFQTC